MRTRIRWHSSCRITSSARPPDRGQLGRVEREPAAAALAGAERGRRRRRPWRSAQPVVEGEQVLGHRRRGRAAIGRRARRAGPSSSAYLLVARRAQRRPAARRRRRPGRSVTSSSRWASSSRAITSSSSSSSDGDPPLQRLELALHPLEVLGVGDQPLVHPLLVARAAGLDLLDVGVDLGLLGGEVVDRRSARRAARRRVSARRGRSARRSRPARAGSRAGGAAGRRASRAPGGPAGRAGRRGRLSALFSCDSGSVHGSVQIVLTRVSTVSPSASADLAATTGSQVHSAAQCATSTSAGPPCSRNSLAGWCRRSLVT